MRWNVSHLEIVLRNNLTFGPSQGRNQLFFSCGGQNDWLVVVPDSETCFWKFWGSCSPPKSTAGYDYPLHSCGPGPSTRTIIPYATGGKAFKVGALLWQRSCFKRKQMRAQQKKQSLRKKFKKFPQTHSTKDDCSVPSAAGCDAGLRHKGVQKSRRKVLTGFNPKNMTKSSKNDRQENLLQT